MALFQHYPADSDAIRKSARAGYYAVDTLDDVRDDLAGRHRATLNEVEGDLEAHLGPLAPYAGTSENQLQQVRRAAVWAACQLEKFADAIDRYDETSTRPRSITRLNQAYADGARDKPDPELKAELENEQLQLEWLLDNAANDVASGLGDMPSDDEVLREWKAGNLPVAAIAAWRSLGLKLTDLPFDLQNSAIDARGLAHLSDQRLASALNDPNLNKQLRDLILEHRPDAVELFGEQWSIDHLPKRFESRCVLGSTGQIVGPDGRLYWVAIPGEGPPDDGTQSAEPQYDFIPDDGYDGPWQTLDEREGQAAYGEPMDDWDDYVLGSLAGFSGYTGPVGEWQSVGNDQASYVYSNDGAVYLGDAVEVPGDSEQPTSGPYSGARINPQTSTPTDALTSALSAMGGADGVTQAEQNRHYATSVTFQEAEDGTLRAVVNLYQVQANGEELRIAQQYGDIDEHGNIVPRDAVE